MKVKDITMVRPQQVLHMLVDLTHQNVQDEYSLIEAAKDEVLRRYADFKLSELQCIAFHRDPKRARITISAKCAHMDPANWRN